MFVAFVAANDLQLREFHTLQFDALRIILCAACYVLRLITRPLAKGNSHPALMVRHKSRSHPNVVNKH